MNHNSINQKINNINSKVRDIINLEGEIILNNSIKSLVFSTGMGAYIEEGFGIPCKKGSIDEIVILSTTPTLSDVSSIQLTLNVYDSNGNNPSQNNIIDYSGNYLVKIFSPSIQLPNDLNQIIIRDTGDLSNVDEGTRFRISLTLVPFS